MHLHTLLNSVFGGNCFFTGFIPIEETVKADSHAETINYLANRVVYKLGDVS